MSETCKLHFLYLIWSCLGICAPHPHKKDEIIVLTPSDFSGIREKEKNPKSTELYFLFPFENVNF